MGDLVNINPQGDTLEAPLTGYLIGEGSLAIYCCEVLIEKGYTLLGIMSSDTQVQNWANTRSLYHTDVLSIFQSRLEAVPGSYLFSVANKLILPKAILDAPKQFVINYHDGPLPKYAGTYVTSWAILNGEAEHGITWHIASEGVDSGDILKQCIFPIDPHETTLSLNLKCYERASQSFLELLDELAHNRVIFIKQNLTSRSFYFSHQRPFRGGLIEWNTSAEQIYALYRALSFGDYSNPLGLPKFILGPQVYIIKKLLVSQSGSERFPGTAILSNDHLEVSTSTKNIILDEITDIHGQRVHFVDLPDELQSDKGCFLGATDHKTVKAIDALNTKIARHEKYWVKKFAEINQRSWHPFIQHMPPFKSRNKLEKILNGHCPLAPLVDRFKEKHTLDIIWLTIFLIYLYRVCNHQTLTVYFSNSTIKSLVYGLPELFAAYVPLSITFESDMNFTDALQVVEQELQDIEKHLTYSQDVFSRYPELNNNPLIMWTLDLTEDAATGDPVMRSPLAIIAHKAHQSFELYAHSSLALNYNEALAPIIQHIHTLTQSVIDHPNAKISFLNFFPKEEKEKILIEWNKTKTEYPAEKLIHHFFEEQAIKTPQKIAVSYEEMHLTYAALNKKANQLAYYLIKLGVRPETIVGICVETNVQLIVAILGVLKAGGAYLPIDPNYPQANIHYILEDSRADIILTNRHFFNHWLSLKKENSCQPVLLDECWSLVEKELEDNPHPLTNPAHAAYVIYTSGSTGTPKGVLVSHKNIVNSIYARLVYYPVVMERSLLFLSPAFDTASAGIIWPLSCGATLFLSTHSKGNYSQIAAEIKQHEITHILSVPTLYLSILEQARIGELTSLKEVILGGEHWPENILKQHIKLIPDAYLYNEYGQTEGTIWSTVKRIYDPVNMVPQSVTIGRPIANVQVYILDIYRQPVPIGVVGELYIGGQGVARGYINKLDATEKNFIPNPFDTERNERLYKTGDLACWLPNGEIDYISRMDNQVKIRGYRVELNAIEACIQASSFVNQCVVTKCSNRKDHAFLVAYIIPKTTNEPFHTRQLCQYLKNLIPEYMIPSSFVVLEHMPLTENGKIDKSALPLPNARQQFTDIVFTPPTTSTEKYLASLWTELLGIEEIGTQDNFFTLGGNSLLIAGFAVKIKMLLNVNLSLKSFFDDPTISHIAKLIDNNHTLTTPNENDLNCLNDAFLKIPLSIKSLSNVKKKPPNAILLTGATGFLGVHLLHELHQLTSAKIYCLVRARDTSEAWKKINKKIFKYHLDALSNSKRIVFLLGDLGEKNLGLSEEVFMRLANEVDTMYHNGALVNHVYDYEALKKINVEGTLELIRLATTHHLKPLHYISTIGAVVSKSVVKEDFASHYSHPADPSNGYLKTKWVAERLLTQAYECGLAVSIYRPGWIGGQRDTGQCEAENNHFLRLIKTCIQFGYAPDKNVNLDILPVDFVSRAIVMLSLNNKKSSGVFNFTNPHVLSWHALITWLQNYGYLINKVPTPIWRQKCFCNLQKENALYPFACLYLNDSNVGWLSAQERMPTIEASETIRALASLDIQYPKINNALLEVYFNYLHTIDFIEKPIKQNQEAYA